MTTARRPVVGALAVALIAGLVFVALHLLETSPDKDASPLAARTAETPATSAAELPESSAARPVDATQLVPASATPPAPTADGTPAAEVGPQQHLLVVDQQDHAVPGALVEIWHRNGPMQMGGRRKGPPLFEATKTLRTDATGRCTVEVSGKAQQVSASKDEFGCSGMRDADWLARVRNTQGESVLVLVPQLEVEGFVLEASDAPVSGAVVTFSANDTLDDYCGWPREPTPFISEKNGWFHGRVDFMQHVNVYAETSDGRVAMASYVGAPGQTAEITLRLQGDWSLGGFVRDDAGQGVAGAKVVAVATDDFGEPLNLHRDFRAGHAEGDTADDGSFALTIDQPGRYLVSAGRPQEVPASRSPVPRLRPDKVTNSGPAAAAALVSISGATAHPLITLVLPRSASITGRVVDARRQPLAGALVNLRAASPTVLAVQWGARTPLRTTVDVQSRQDGSFRIEDLPADGRFEIRASPHTPGAQAPNPAAPWEPVEMDGHDVLLVVDVEALARSVGSVRARVIARGGGPITGFRWGWCREGQISMALFQGCTTPDGSFEIPGLDVEARYTVAVATADGGMTDVHDVAPAPDGTPLLLTVAPPVALDVDVVDAHGAPVPGTHVLLQRSFSASWNMTGLPSAALTDAQGRAHLEKLPQGRYTLKVHTGNGSGEATAEVGDGPNTVRIVVSPEKQG